MSRYIDANALYEKTAEWEAQALHMVELHINDEDKTEWKRWSVILTERSAFKFDIADSPTANVVEVVHGEWIPEPNCYYRCSNCKGHLVSIQNKINYSYCPYCGADMRGGDTK